jgi:outer membrane protein assembly factor BamB
MSRRRIALFSPIVLLFCACSDAPSDSPAENELPKQDAAMQVQTGADTGGPTGAGDGQAPDVPANMEPDSGEPNVLPEAGPPVDAGPPRHHLLVVEFPAVNSGSRLVEISAAGQLQWEHPIAGQVVMVQILANGNYFYPYAATPSGVEEVDRNHKVVWSYTSTAPEVWGGERLPNGNSLLGEEGPCAAVEINPARQIARSLALTTQTTDTHHQIRKIHQLPNGNILGAMQGEGAAREYDSTGKTVWEYKNVPGVWEALRLANGNTLLGGGDSKRVLEITPQGQIAWELNATDVPELGLTYIASVQVLKSGNLLVCNWLGHDGGTGVHAFEVTRNKQVVWKLNDHQMLKSVATAIAIDD